MSWLAGAQRVFSELLMGGLNVAGLGHPTVYPLEAGSLVKVLEGPSTCQYCDVSRWLGSRKGVPHLHWPSFNDLQASYNKCPICHFSSRRWFSTKFSEVQAVPFSSPPSSARTSCGRNLAQPRCPCNPATLYHGHGRFATDLVS